MINKMYAFEKKKKKKVFKKRKKEVLSEREG